MALQQNGSQPDFDFNQALGLLTTIGASIFGVIKWLERRNEKRRKALTERELAEEKEKFNREEWLIDNAFDIVKELRDEVARLRAQLADERAEHERKMRDMDAKLVTAQKEVQELERALFKRGD